jgi:hypothetical protein
MTVLKFKVWRLSHEWRTTRAKSNGVWVYNRSLKFVLRDPDGYVRKVAKNAIEEADLKKWYKNYNSESQLENLVADEKLKEHISEVKSRVRNRGYIKRIVFCGIYKDPLTGENGYRRYEVFKRERWKRKEVARLHYCFKCHLPRPGAAIFMFEPEWKGGTLFADEQDWLSRGTERVCSRWSEFLETHPAYGL